MKNTITILLLMLMQYSYAQQGINLEGYSYPYPVKYMKFSSQQQDLTMAYMYEKSVSPNGKTVLLLHGKNFCSAYWSKVMEKLLAGGYNVVAADQVGFGKSAKPENYQYTFQQLSLNTKKLLDTLHISQITILAHSMGGMLGIRFALMFPRNVQQLILENPIGLEDWKRSVPYVDIDKEYLNELHKTKEDFKTYMLQNYFHNEWKETYDTLLNVFARFLNSKEYPRYAWNAAQTSDMIFTQPVYYELKELNIPVTLIIGQLDRTAIGKNRVDELAAAKMGNYPKLGKQACKSIRKAKLVKLADCGHIPHIEDPDLFMINLFVVLK